MKCGEFEIPDWRIEAMCLNLALLFLQEMKDPEIRARVAAKAEELRAEKEAQA